MPYPMRRDAAQARAAQARAAQTRAALPYAMLPPHAPPVRNVGAPLAVIIALGTIAALILSLLTAVNPAGAAVGFGLSTVAMAAVVTCYLWLDRWEPEPPRLLVLAFLWGTSVAVLISLAAENLIEASLPGEQTNFATAAIVAPVVEEAAKGLFLLLMMTGRRRNELNTLTDCLVYAGLTGAGFAWLENIFYIASGESLAGSLAIAGLRLIMGPFAHPLFTTMFAVGVYFALRQRNTAARLGALGLGYVAAVLLHALWNGSAVLGPGTYLGVYLLWMMPVFGLAIAVAVTSRRRESRIIAGQLPAMVSTGLVSSADAAWLSSIPSRKAAVSAATRYGGRRSGSAVKRYVLDVVKLAYVRDRIDRGFGDERVFALQHEEASRVVANRAAAAPVLAQLAAYRLPAR